MISLKVGNKDIAKLKLGKGIKVGPANVSMSGELPNMHIQVPKSVVTKFHGLATKGKPFILKPSMIEAAMLKDDKTGGAVSLGDFVTSARRQGKKAVDKVEDLADDALSYVEDVPAVAKRAAKQAVVKAAKSATKAVGGKVSLKSVVNVLKKAAPTVAKVAAERVSGSSTVGDIASRQVQKALGGSARGMRKSSEEEEEPTQTRRPRPVKGSQEAKQMMAAIRARRGGSAIPLGRGAMPLGGSAVGF